MNKREFSFHVLKYGLLLFCMPMLTQSLHSPASAAEFSTPLFGGGGGNKSYNLDCGAGAVIVGVTSKTGMFVDAIGIICQRVKPNGSLGEEFTRGPVGGTGGVARTSRCNQGNVAQGIIVKAGQFIDDGTFLCSQWIPTQKQPQFSTSGLCQGDRCTTSFRGGQGSAFGVGGTQGDTFYCPSGKAGKAIRGRHGIYIDSLRFVCDNWDK
jgi:hypothetical protein